MDEGGRCLMANRAVREGLGLEAGAEVGVEVAGWVVPEGRDGFRADLEKALGGEVGGVIWRFLGGDGRVRRVKGSLARLGSGGTRTVWDRRWMRAVLRDEPERGVEGLEDEPTEVRMPERLSQDLDSVYRRAIEAAGAVPYVLDHRTARFSFMGRGIEGLTGYTVEEMTPQLWDRIGVESVMQGEAAGLSVAEAVARSRSGRLSQWRCDTLIRCKGGEERWVAEAAVDWRGVDGKALGAVGVLIDVTDRKRAIDALVASERNLKEAQRVAQLGSWTQDLVARRLVWSDEIYRIFEVDPERHQASLEVFMMRVHPEDRERVHAEYLESVAKRRPYEVVHRLLLDGGRIRYVQERGETRYGADGTPLMTHGTVQDITDRVRDSQRLRLQSEVLGALTRGLSLGGVLDVLCARVEQDHGAKACYVMQRQAGQVSRVLSGPSLDPVVAGRLTGPAPGEDAVLAGAGGLTVAEHVGEGEGAAGARGLVGEVAREQGWVSVWSIPILADARLFGSLVVAHAVRLEVTEVDRAWMGECARLAGIAVARHRAERALAESEAHFRTLADSGKALIWTTDSSGVCDYVNLPWLRFTGRTLGEECGGGWLERVHPADRERCVEVRGKAFAGREGFTQKFRLRRADGEYRWMEDQGTPRFDTTGEYLGHIGHCFDVTQRLEMERQSNRSQRLEAIGQLAGGVAHDLNNALAPILMTLPLLKLDYPEGGEMLDTVETSAARCAEMVRQLLTFARGAEGERQAVAAGRLVKEIEKIVRGTFPKNIELRTEVGPAVRPILGDPTQLHQVLLNLCVNARDAMPGGGILTVQARDFRVDEVFASGVPEARPGQYVLFEVVDTGCGIPGELLDRIFEPFFTTKGPDHGTGLGLSTVVGIVKGHGGFLRVQSEPGQGSCFAVYLPAARVVEVEEAPGPARKAQLVGGGRTVLVVDDEAPLRKAFSAVLESVGFRVLTASDGAEALIAASENREQLRLIITDLRMPTMDGMELARMLRRILAEVPIIVASGLIDASREAELESLGVAIRLGKPFTRDTLIDAIRSILGEGG